MKRTNETTGLVYDAERLLGNDYPGIDISIDGIPGYVTVWVSRHERVVTHDSTPVGAPGK
jgi:hypothetical protein